MKSINKTIITVSLTGSHGSKKLNPNIPITCDEMIEDAYQCYREGASIAHFHVKAEDGETAEINNEKFKYIKQEMNKKCDMIINFSTSGEITKINGLELIGTADAYQEKRISILDTRPEIATFDIPTMHFNRKIFMNPMPFLENLGTEMINKNILPEVEIYNPGDLAMADELITEGYLNPNSFFQFCMGIRGGIPASVKNLLHLQETLPANKNWSAFGVGAAHLPIMYATLALGGHIRVGLEDNLYYTKGEKTTNVKLVSRAVRVIKEFGNDVATPEEAREILGVMQ